MVKEKFGKTFGLQENSLYKAVLKERKITDKKSGGSGIKMKEIVHEAINHFGNPVSFRDKSFSIIIVITGSRLWCAGSTVFARLFSSLSNDYNSELYFADV